MFQDSLSLPSYVEALLSREDSLLVASQSLGLIICLSCGRELLHTDFMEVPIELLS